MSLVKHNHIIQGDFITVSEYQIICVSFAVEYIIVGLITIFKFISPCIMVKITRYDNQIYIAQFLVNILTWKS